LYKNITIIYTSLCSLYRYNDDNYRFEQETAGGGSEVNQYKEEKHYCLARTINGPKECLERWCDAEDFCIHHPDYKPEEEEDD